MVNISLVFHSSANIFVLVIDEKIYLVIFCNLLFATLLLIVDACSVHNCNYIVTLQDFLIKALLPLPFIIVRSSNPLFSQLSKWIFVSAVLITQIPFDLKLTQYTDWQEQLCCGLRESEYVYYWFVLILIPYKFILMLNLSCLWNINFFLVVCCAFSLSLPVQLSMYYCMFACRPHTHFNKF